MKEEIRFPMIADGEDKTSSLKNCIRNNYRHIRKWAKRTQTNAFRLYDREVKGYPVTIDFYDGRFCVQFLPKQTQADQPSTKLKNEVEKTLHDLFRVELKGIFWKTRKRHALKEQYEKIGDSRQFFIIYEYGLKFKINLNDYLDTGLFLDHRETRHLVAELSYEKRVLNLFAYTCSFSVHAAAGGASFTKSVDMSNTYTQWGKENFLLNDYSLKNNMIVREDCLKFLEKEVQIGERYDLIIIDPPTLSRSKKMERSFNIQLDYPFLIAQSLKLLSSEGTILFSTNSRTFKFDRHLFKECSVEEITNKTIPLDIRNKKIHSCWKIRIGRFHGCNRI